MKNKITCLSYILIFLLNTSPSLANNINQKPQAIIEIQKGETEKKVPFNINLDGSKSKGENLKYEWKFPDKIIRTKNPRPYKFTKAGHYTISLKISDGKNEDRSSIEIFALPKEKNGNLSENILINEIMPNPEGIDTNKEWIELYNQGDKKVNLGNWTINSNVLSDKLEIKSKNFLIIEKENLTFNIKNKDFEITLKDFKGKTIDQVNYNKSKKALSYSKITINNKTKLTWTTPSKALPNQNYKVIKGKIAKSGEFKIKIPKSQNQKLIQTLFKKGRKVSILAEEKNNEYILEKYKFQNKIPTNKKSHEKTYYLLIPSIFLAIALKYYNTS